ncbi:MAG: helix-turn-helix domain-containing protein [Acidobacteriota bacterium]
MGMLARVLNVSPSTVQAWEAGRRTPSDAALKLLAIAAKHPKTYLIQYRSREPQSGGPRLSLLTFLHSPCHVGCFGSKRAPNLNKREPELA